MNPRPIPDKPAAPRPEPSRTWAQRGLWAATLCLWAGLFIGTHIPARAMPDVRVSDKTLHAAAYFSLAAMIYLSTWIANPSRRRLAVLVLAICMIYGAIDELLQPFVRRHADLEDWLCDVAGAAAAVMLLALLRRLLPGGSSPQAPAPAAPPPPVQTIEV
jgi:hypothetical protein